MTDKSQYYLNHFIKLDSAGQFIKDKLYPNVKEISESMSAYMAVAQNISNHREGPMSFGDKDTQCLVVGDGSRPRTGALFACMTRWNVCSIDPALSQKKYSYQRLTQLRKRIEESQQDILDIKNKHVILVQVHSHAKLDNCLKTIVPIGCKSLSIVSIPCCVPQLIKDLPPDIEYEDWHCLSVHRTVKIWKGIKL